MIGRPLWPWLSERGGWEEKKNKKKKPKKRWWSDIRPSLKAPSWAIPVYQAHLHLRVFICWLSALWVGFLPPFIPEAKVSLQVSELICLPVLSTSRIYSSVIPALLPSSLASQFDFPLQATNMCQASLSLYETITLMCAFFNSGRERMLFSQSWKKGDKTQNGFEVWEKSDEKTQVA